MKNLIITILLLASVNVTAKNIYISSSGGNDGNLGLAPASAWKTVAKLNASWASIVAGDSILLKRGDTFYGSIVVAKSGSTGMPIIIGAYGTGAKPVISGFTTLTGWTSVGTNLWECSALTIKDSINILTVDGVAKEVGRTDWMVYQATSSTPTNQITSNTTLTTSYVGAEIVVKKNSFAAERGIITGQSGNTFTFRQGRAIDNSQPTGFSKGTNLFGFYLQRFPESLNAQNEWYFNTVTNKMRIYSVANPSTYTIRATYIDTVINLNNRTNIIVSNLAIEGAGMYGIESYGGANVTINNCDFNNNTRAVHGWNTFNIVVYKCTFNNSFNAAILVSNNQQKQITITDNVVRNTGQLLGMGLFWSGYNLKAIIARTGTDTTTNFVNIIENKIYNTGHGVIEFQGGNVKVRRNVIDTFCNVLDDQGGIYTFLSNSGFSSLVHVNRLVDSNFIMHGIGAPIGSNGIVDVVGYYMDDQSKNVIGRHNTIAHINGPGAQFNNTVNNTFTQNTIYACHATISINKKSFSELIDNRITNNILYQKDNSEFNLTHSNANLSLPTLMTITQSMRNMAYIDSNYITNLRPTGIKYYYSTNGVNYTFPSDISLETFRGTYLHDLISKLPPIPVTNTNTVLVINPYPTDSVHLFTGYNYMSAEGVNYPNSVTIPAYMSKLLIYNGTTAVPNQPPTVTIAGGTQTITLPTSSASVTSTGIDTDGSISSYLWTLVSGPSIPVFVTPSVATTTVNSLTTAGEYILQVRVTDDNGATGTATVKIIVNPAVPPPNAPPVARAGTDSTITLPYDSTTLIATGSTDSDGTITYVWTKFSGPAAGTIVTPTGSITKARGLVQGTYQFLLTVTDDDGATSTDIVQVIVNSAANQWPVADAGIPQIIALPLDSVQLTGTGTDFDGTIVTYYWLKTAGPTGTGIITSIDSATTMVTGLVAGNYTFRLTVTDNQGASAISSVNIDVLPIVPPPLPAGTKKGGLWKKKQ